MKILIVGTQLNSAVVDACRMALNFEMPQDGSAPEWIELLPAGAVIVGRDGRAFANDQPDMILQAFAVEGKDLPIDWEHASELKAPNGDQAPAAGWIKQMEIRENGSIWGRVEWTAKGAASVSSKEYRYLSPVFIYDKASSRILRITSCGLTNQPNLFLNALNREPHKEELSMNAQQFAALLAALGLAATTTADQALNHITQMKGDLVTALNSANSPSLDKFVPRSDYDKALNRATTAEAELKKVQDAQLDTAINSEIDAALKAGKITPTTKDYHVAQCRQEGGLERFKAFVAVAPVTAADTDLDKRKVDGQGTALNAEEQAACKALGISEEEYRKANPV